MPESSLGRSVTTAIDHGLHWGALEGLENPGETLDRVLDAEPDGVLASPPLLRRYGDRIASSDIDTIATLDMLYDSTLPGDQENAEIHSQVFDVDEVIGIADAAKVALVFGREDPNVLEKNAEFVASAAKDCREAEIPLVVEPTLWGARAEDEFDPEYLAHANRLAFELGADVLKSPYPERGFEPIVSNAPQPMYIAGGPATETDRAMLKMASDACDAGASGVMFGRNIWQRENPTSVINALSAIVHDGATPDEAARYL